MNSITLVEGVPFEKELVQLKSRYHTTKFPGLFRAEKIDIYNLPPATRQASGGSLSQVQSNGFQPPPAQQYSGPFQPSISPEVHGFVAPTADMTSNAALNPTAQTWAATAKAPRIASPTPAPAPPPPPAEPAIARNKYGQRIDPVVKYDPSEVKRIKAMKMCNVHFLRDDCPYSNCTHDHHYKPNQNELNTLRYISRLTPCRYGMECDDAKCIYGHRCPVQKEGEKGCRFGDSCRFPEEAHGVDLRVVNTVRIGAK